MYPVYLESGWKHCVSSVSRVSDPKTHYPVYLVYLLSNQKHVYLCVSTYTLTPAYLASRVGGPKIPISASMLGNQGAGDSGMVMLQVHHVIEWYHP